MGLRPTSTRRPIGSAASEPSQPSKDGPGVRIGCRVDRDRTMGRKIMPIHDWTRVDAGIFHHFHLGWIGDLFASLESRIAATGLLCPGRADRRWPRPGRPHAASPEDRRPVTDEPAGGVALPTTPPRVQFRTRAEPDLYAAKAKTIVIRHISKHRIIAIVEIVSPETRTHVMACAPSWRRPRSLAHGHSPGDPRPVPTRSARSSGHP